MVGERCEMCAEPISDEHPHVVDLESRALMCTCRGCYLLFTAVGEWSPQEAVDFLVERVGHERDNATAEVRRSFQGGYGPLYQAGYLLGGLQLRALRRDLVDSKLMTDKAFHDEILRQGNMPISFVRLAVGKTKLTRGMPVDWKFYGDNPAK